MNRDCFNVSACECRPTAKRPTNANRLIQKARENMSDPRVPFYSGSKRRDVKAI